MCLIVPSEKVLAKSIILGPPPLSIANIANQFLKNVYDKNTKTTLLIIAQKREMNSCTQSCDTNNPLTADLD